MLPRHKKEDKEDSSPRKISIDVDSIKEELEAVKNEQISEEEDIDKLKSRVKELEKFEKFAVGRELRMKELKKRIAELEQKVKEKKNN